MLDSITKRRIDTCRDILVGKVPDPKSQVEQITLALIYKFMDDMDAQSEEIGGKRSFFAGDFAQYGWAKLLSPAVGGFEMIGLYSEAIARMPQNPGVPILFRDIFKNAYLPYKDPETLRAFLKEINYFTYEHSEKLGDAFEYLLSILGSQGDAGQFRTPRHIIDFIVAVVDPQKNETVLDPACGTAGFLISSYKHILQANQKDQPGDLLTADERTRLAQNLTGYDISPDMVRLSLANLYLHGFPEPQVEEYDTLTSDDKWNEYADVILANPPFMSPKGGIKPHKRFSVQSNRSEVLFVDYIAEHLTPTGRAGVIVPEGIIFQSGTTYKTLREMLVKKYLVAVVSLPAGVFQPYSGVKTSVLVMDKRLAKTSDSILFVKIASDGFGLGAQRRAVALDDLPEAKRLLADWMESLRDGTPFEAGGAANVQVVEKTKIGASGDYNLGAERYISVAATFSKYEIVSLGEICEYVRGVVYSKQDEVEEDGWAVLRANNINQITNTLDLSDIRLISKTVQLNEKQKLRKGDTLICAASGSADHVGKVAYSDKDAGYYFGGFMAVVRAQPTVLPQYLFACLKTEKFRAHIAKHIIGANIQNLKSSIVYDFTIPLPPLAVQQEIVAEIEGYQKVIDGARQVVENYKPRIDVRPEWPMVELEEVCEINPESLDPTLAFPNGSINYIDIASVENETGYFNGGTKVLSSDAPSRARRKVVAGDVLLSTVRPNLKAFTLLREVPEQTVASTGFAVLRANKALIEPGFLISAVRSQSCVDQMVRMMGKGAYPSINSTDVKGITIPLPDLETQQTIAGEIEEEQRLVDASKALIQRFEAKSKAAISRVWGEDAAMS